MRRVIIMDNFIIYALVAAIGIALVCAPLGCFVVWKRMAYFGDSLAHSSLLGVAMGVLLGWQVNLSILLMAAAFSLLLVFLQRQKLLAIDTLLGILAHAALAFGVIIFSLSERNSVDIYSYLFGDILSITEQDLWVIGMGGLVVLGTIALCWSKFTLIALNEEMAQAEGVPVLAMNIVFMLLMSVVVAISIQIVGIILITSLLVIPAASARQLARSPIQMLVFASIFAVLSVIGGFYGSLQWDLPSGPAIVATASCLFVIALLLRATFASRIR